MRPLLLVLSLLLALPAGAKPTTEAKANRLVVVVNADNKIAKLERSALRSIYLGLTTFWSEDRRVKPYQRAHDGAAGKPFFRDVLGMTPARYRHTWQKQQLSGQGVEPEVIASAATLVAKVAATTGAIGYMLESEAPATDARVRLIPLE